MIERKTFRIDQLRDKVAASFAPDPDADALQRHREVVMEIRALRAAIEPRPHEAERVIDPSPIHIAEVQKLKAELDAIKVAISRTKQEIATVHVGGFRGREMRRVADELDAVVSGAKAAIEHILNAAEEIEQCSRSLSALSKTEQERSLAHKIVERVVEIFEACNFHDLSGQRIAKVVATLKFIEARVKTTESRATDESNEFAPAGSMVARDSNSTLGGPGLLGETGHASQDDIDVIFD
jgi:chemotaxis protein CheZ